MRVCVRFQGETLVEEVEEKLTVQEGGYTTPPTTNARRSCCAFSSERRPESGPEAPCVEFRCRVHHRQSTHGVVSIT